MYYIGAFKKAHVFFKSLIRPPSSRVKRPHKPALDFSLRPLIFRESMPLAQRARYPAAAVMLRNRPPDAHSDSLAQGCPL